MKVYLAGPMSGYPSHNFPAFDAAAAALRAVGHEVVSPAEIDREHGFDPNDSVGDAQYGLFLRRSLKAMLECEAIALLPGVAAKPRSSPRVRGREGHRHVVGAHPASAGANRVAKPAALGEATRA